MMKPGEDEIETTQMETIKTTTGGGVRPSADEQEPLPPSATTAIPFRTTPAVIVTPPPVPKQPKMVTTTISSSPPPPPNPSSKKSFGRMQAKVRLVPQSRKGQLNTRYLATVPGVLKIAEVILGFVAFILAICADRRSTSSAWTEHITFETTLVVCVFIILYVVFPHLSLSNEQTREGLLVVELMFYGLNTLFFFIGIWLMVHLAASWTAEGRGAAIMSAILCLALTVLYTVETFIKYKAWTGQDVVTRTNSPYASHVPPAPVHQQQNGGEGDGIEKRYEPSGNPNDDDHVVV